MRVGGPGYRPFPRHDSVVVHTLQDALRDNAVLSPSTAAAATAIYIYFAGRHVTQRWLQMARSRGTVSSQMAR